MNTTLALISIVDQISQSLQNGHVTVGLFLDFKKAFDTVDHRILLRKLEKYGIRGLLHDWILDYLTNRRQFVSIQGHHSSYAPVSYGVPQGSILGPLLFILYINDFCNISNVFTPYLYADDSNCFINGNNVPDAISKLNSELDKIFEWTTTNKVSINVSKTHFVVFSTKNVPHCQG